MYQLIDTWLVNKNGVKLVINQLYRFSWQKTLAHWYLKRVYGDTVIMESKNWKTYKWKSDELVYKNPKNTKIIWP